MRPKQHQQDHSIKQVRAGDQDHRLMIDGHLTNTTLCLDRLPKHLRGSTVINPGPELTPEELEERLHSSRNRRMTSAGVRYYWGT